MALESCYRGTSKDCRGQGVIACACFRASVQNKFESIAHVGEGGKTHRDRAGSGVLLRPRSQKKGVGASEIAVDKRMHSTNTCPNFLPYCYWVQRTLNRRQPHFFHRNGKSFEAADVLSADTAVVTPVGPWALCSPLQWDAFGGCNVCCHSRCLFLVALGASRDHLAPCEPIRSIAMSSSKSTRGSFPKGPFRNSAIARVLAMPSPRQNCFCLARQKLCTWQVWRLESDWPGLATWVRQGLALAH